VDDSASINAKDAKELVALCDDFSEQLQDSKISEARLVRHLGVFKYL